MPEAWLEEQLRSSRWEACGIAQMLCVPHAEERPPPVLRPGEARPRHKLKGGVGPHRVQTLSELIIDRKEMQIHPCAS